MYIDKPLIRQVFTLCCLAGAIACIFPLPHPFFQVWRTYSAQISLGYLFLGLVFLMFNRPRLMLACFGCSAAISFYFYETTF
jgi:hypothetical protein